jgi:type I restriction-modification system DNA methylase subunit
VGSEDKLWKAADKLHNNIDSDEYKHVVLGLIFLKYVSDSFIEVYNKLKNDPEKQPCQLQRKTDLFDSLSFNFIYISNMIAFEWQG